MFENYSVGNYPIEILRNSTIGIELSHYISRLLTFKRESFVELINSFPNTLFSHIENDLKTLSDLNIKPIFIFEGLSTQLNFDIKIQDSLTSAEIVKINKWDQFNKNMKVDTFRDYQTPLSVNTSDVLQFFESHDVEYLVAPYHAIHQLYYMLQQNVIDVMYGSTDLLLFPLPLEKFIFCIEFQNQEFKFMDKSYILNKFQLTDKSFLEMAMCCGNICQPYNLSIFQNGLEINFQQLLDFINNGGSVFNTILSSPNQEFFFKGLSMMKFQPVLNLKGHLQILKSADDKLPNDLHDFIGQRLANEYYYYQSLGLTNLKTIEAVLYGTYMERLSLDTNPHRFYVDLVTDTDFMNKILNLSTNFMHRYFQFKKYNLKVILPNDVRVLELSPRFPRPLYLTTRKFVYKSIEDFTLPEFFSKFETSLKVSQAANAVKPENSAELISTSITRTLFLLDLIDEDGKLTKYGKLLPTLKSKESLLLLLFFARFNLKLSIRDIGLGKFDVLSKVLAIYHTSDIKPINYTNKISQSLLQFNSVFSKLQMQVNELICANLLSILFNNEFSKKFEYTKKQWSHFVQLNPFSTQFNSTLVGILNDSFTKSFTNVEESKTLLNASFGNVFVDKTPFDVLQDGFTWYHGEVMSLVSELGKLGLLPKDVCEGLKEADQWLVENSLT